ncbi:MAG: preprotein translocase subunit YajC, partial [Bdellovibrionota bacterium]
MLKFLTLNLLFVSQVWAMGAAQTPGTQAAPNSFLMQLPIMLALFGLFYFVLIRPQRQQQKKHLEFISSIGKGDEVILASGFIGRIVGLTDKVASIEIAQGVEVKVLRTQI